MSKPKPFICVNHGKNQINLLHLGEVDRMRPVEIHLREDGSVLHEPSFCIVMRNMFGNDAIGEISLAMLNAGLYDIGYKLSKIEP